MFEDNHSYKPERVRTCDKTQQNNIFTHGYLNILFVYLIIHLFIYSFIYLNDLSNAFRSVTVYAQGHIIIFQQSTKCRQGN